MILKRFSNVMLLAPLIVTIAPEAHSAGASSDEATRMFSRGDAYEQFMGRWSRQLAPPYVRFAALRDGDRVLDVGTGTGSLASTVSAMLPASTVIGIDPSKEFIEHAHRLATPSSKRLRFDVGDAQKLGYPDASFDHAMAMLVMNFIPDHARALGEMKRVTRPGGSVSACVWDYNEGMRMLRIFWDEAVALDPAIAPKDERYMKLTRAGQLGTLWREAGLVNVREDALEVDLRFASFEDYWAPFLTGTGPAGALVAAMPAERRTALESRLRKRLLADRPNGPFTLGARTWCVRGRVPDTGPVR